MQRTIDRHSPRQVSQDSTRFLHRLLDNLAEVLIVRREVDRGIVYISASIEDKLGTTAGEYLAGDHLWLDRVPDADREFAREALRRERSGESKAATEFRLVAGDRSTRWLSWQTRSVDIDDECFLVTTIRDVTAERDERERWRGQALRDPLTGLWNRRGLDEMVRHELGRRRRTGEPVSAILIDIDDFKLVNERLGHAGGDRVLCSVAAAILRTVRPSDPSGRIGGDEFLVLLPGAGVGEARRIAERVRRAIGREPGPTRVSASLGVALVHDEDVTVDVALRRTESALKRSKRTGKNRVAMTAG